MDKVPALVVVAGYGLYAVYYGLEKLSLIETRSGNHDTVDSNVSCNSLPAEKENQVEIQVTHNHLITFLNGEIQGSGTDEFESIQHTSMSIIGRASALACSSIRDIIKELEIAGKVSPGQYSFLVDNILKPSGFQHYTVLDKIEEIRKKIQRLLNPESETTESPTGSSEALTSETETVHDAVIFYAETDSARKKAIEFKKVVTNISPPSASIELWEECGHGGVQKLEAREKITKTHRYIFFLMTHDIHEDPEHKFVGGMLLSHFNDTNQDRLIPIWFDNDRTNFPIWFSQYTGLNYALWCSQEQDVKDLFILSFTKLIYRGRRIMKNL